MKKYEAVYILDIRKVDDEGAAFSKEFAALIEKLGGKVETTVPMGRRQFTYEINKRKAGLYFDFVFECDPLKLADIKENYRLDERILRSLTIAYDRPENVPAGPISLNIE